MKRIAFISGASGASTASACGPCSAISARSRSGSMMHASESCARRCASSAALRAALTTSMQMIALVRHHEVVEDAALGIGEQRVALPPGRQAEHIARHQCFERPRGIFDASRARADRDLAHVRDVEQAGGGAGVKVLLDDAGRILHRHVVARERHHARTEPQVELVEWRAPKCLC